MKMEFLTQFFSAKRKKNGDSIYFKEFEVLDLIGEGSYAAVFKCRNSASMKTQKVAVKRVSKEKTLKQFLDLELEANKRLNHENIVSTYSHFEDSSNLYLVQEYFKGENLFNYLEKRRFAPMDEKRGKLIFKQLLEALNYAHSKGVNHRDIKLENILYNESDGKVKLVDWGLCSIDTSLADQWVGSPDYVAPQILLHQPYNPELADCWSLGVILFILLTGKLPFNRKSRKEQLSLGNHPFVVFPSECGVSIEARDLIRSLLQFQSENRMNLQKTLSHIWLQ